MNPELNFIPVDRYWFLTWTTYGTWLLGDERGFVGVARQVRRSNHVPKHAFAPVDSNV